MMIAISIILSLILIYAVFTLVVFLVAFRRRKDLDWLNPACLENTSWEMIKDNPKKANDWILSKNYEDFSVKTFDGLTLKGKFIKNENAKGTIIVVHGYRGNYIGDYGLVIPLFYKYGYNVLMFRQRSHGESQGKYITFGVKEHKDLLTIIDFHNIRYGEIPIFISGISMGASTALFAVDKDLPANVKGVSADCGFSSPYDIILKVVSNTLKINGKFLMFGVNVWCKILAKFDMKECSSLDVVKNSKVPIVFIHGKKDDLVPYTMTIDAYNSCCQDKVLVIVDSAGHGTSFIKDEEKVTSTLVNFFNKHLND